MKRFAYFSTVADTLESEGIADICRLCLDRNPPLALTGILYHQGLNFLQVLEGEEDRVDPLLERILADTRHYGVKVLFSEAVTTRAFANFKVISTDREVRNLVGLPTPAPWAEKVDRDQVPEEVRRLLDGFEATVRR